MSVFDKECPLCDAAVPISTEYCDCGFAFESTPLEQAAQGVLLATQEEELYETYLAARVGQLQEELKVAQSRLSVIPGDGELGLLVRNAQTQATAASEGWALQLKHLEKSKKAAHAAQKTLRKSNEVRAKVQRAKEAKARAEAQAIAEAKARAEEEARAATQARAELEARKKEEAARKARAEAEAQAAAQAKAEQEAREKEQAAIKARAEAEAKVEAQEKAATQARAELKAHKKEQAAIKARAEAETQAAAQAKIEQEALGKEQAAQEAQSARLEDQDFSAKEVEMVIGTAVPEGGPVAVEAKSQKKKTQKARPAKSAAKVKKNGKIRKQAGLEFQEAQAEKANAIMHLALQVLQVGNPAKKSDPKKNTSSVKKPKPPVVAKPVKPTCPNCTADITNDMEKCTCGYQLKIVNEMDGIHLTESDRQLLDQFSKETTITKFG